MEKIVARFSVVNVIATADLVQRLDLTTLAYLEGILYDELVYGGRVAYLRTPNVSGTVTFFASGKMISTGTRSSAEAVLRLEYARDFLVREGLIKPVVIHPRIENIVINVDIGNCINLMKLALTTGLDVVYQPRLFPGAKLNLAVPHRATAMVFSSGKVVLLGVRNQSSVEETVDSLEVVLRPFRQMDGKT